MFDILVSAKGRQTNVYMPCEYIYIYIYVDELVIYAYISMHIWVP